MTAYKPTTRGLSGLDYLAKAVSDIVTSATHTDRFLSILSNDNSSSSSKLRLIGNALDNLAGATNALNSLTSLLGGGSLPGEFDKIRRALGPLSAALASLERTLKKISRALRIAQYIKDKIEQAIASFKRVKEALDKLLALIGLGPEEELKPKLRPKPQPPAPGHLNHNNLLIMTSVDKEVTFYFNISTASFDKLKRTATYNIVSLKCLGRRDSMQAIGKGGETITLSGVIFAQYGGIYHVARMRAVAARIMPLELVTGTGLVLGKWYITAVSEEQDAFMYDGVPRRQSFSMELASYGQDNYGRSN